MNTLVTKPLAKKVSFDSDTMWVELTDGRKLGVPLAYFPRLLKARSSERKAYQITGAGSGLHWDKLNEDISVEYLLLGIGDRTQTKSRTRQAA